MSVPPQWSVGGSPAENPVYRVGEDAAPAQERSAAAPLALGALIVCIAAFVLGLVPLLGVVFGLGGIVLVVLAARRGAATKRTYAGAAAAAVGVLASLATTALVIGAVLAPSGGPDSEPVVASEETAELEDETESTTSELTDEEETSSEKESSTEPEPEPVETEAPEPIEKEEPEPSDKPAAEPETEPDLSAYEEIDERTLAQIVKSPDDHIGTQVILYGQITQLDAATGKCFVRISISHAPQDDWYDYEHNSVGFAGDGESDCPVLDPFVADDEVKLWVTIGGSLSYDTQIGGSTTVPAYLIADVELL